MLCPPRSVFHVDARAGRKIFLVVFSLGSIISHAPFVQFLSQWISAVCPFSISLGQHSLGLFVPPH